MKKRVAHFGELIRVIASCIRISFQSSHKYFCLRIVFTCIGIAAPFLSIYLSREIVNALVSGFSQKEMASYFFSQFLFFAIFLILSEVLQRICESLSEYCERMHRDIIMNYTRNEISKKAAALDLSYFDSVEFYNELQDATQNSYQINETAFRAIQLLRFLIQLVIALVCVMQFHVFYGLLLLLSGIPGVLFNQAMFEKLYSWQRSTLGLERKITYLVSLVTQRAFAKDIRQYGVGDHITDQYNRLWKDWFGEKKKVSAKYVKKVALASILPQLITLAAIVQIGQQIFFGSYTVGDYSYYYGLITQLLSSIYLVISYYGFLSDGKIRVLNYMKFQKWENRVKDEGEQTLSGDFRVEFRDVTFSYLPGQPVLKNIHLHFSSKDRIAFVGINGSGKSTMIKLLLRFYDPDEGSILINGVDIREYSVRSVRDSFGVLFQDYCNYAFSVKDSVTLSNIKEAADTGQIYKALEQSGAAQFVSQFKNGLDTYLTRQYEETGEELSGGQWQKIALARTFFKTDSKMIILDEPSAALDPQAEHDLFERFRELYREKGAIFISHRLSNIMAADKIVVIENGEITEQGNHEQLMGANGRYAYLFRLQAKNYEVKKERSR